MSVLKGWAEFEKDNSPRRCRSQRAMPSWSFEMAVRRKQKPYSTLHNNMFLTNTLVWDFEHTALLTHILI